MKQRSRSAPFSTAVCCRSVSEPETSLRRRMRRWVQLLQTESKQVLVNGARNVEHLPGIRQLSGHGFGTLQRSVASNAAESFHSSTQDVLIRFVSVTTLKNKTQTSDLGCRVEIHLLGKFGVSLRAKLGTTQISQRSCPNNPRHHAERLESQFL